MLPSLRTGDATARGATTNPSPITAAARLPEYADVVGSALR